MSNVRLIDNRFHDGLVQQWLVVMESGVVATTVAATEYAAIGNLFLKGVFRFGDKAYSVTPMSGRYKK